MSDIDKHAANEHALQTLAEILDDIVKSMHGESGGFALLTFKLNEPGVANYISNAQRASMIQALRETADRLEAQEDIPAGVGSVN